VAPVFASAATLDEAFSNFRECNFRGFFYAPWDPQHQPHPYFSERDLKPYKEDSGLYYFKVKDTLFGLPVVEIIVPGTWDLHAVIFDVPLADARRTLKRQFGDEFRSSDNSRDGRAPVLEMKSGESNRSALYCNEVEGGE
jgi:hypothetical protein